MDDIELDDFGEKNQQPPEDRDDNYDWDDWQETTFNHPDDDSDVRENLKEMKKADRELMLDIANKRRKLTNIKKSILWKLGIKVNKGDGRKNTTSLFERMKITTGEKGNVTSAKFDGVKIIVQGKGKKFRFTENVKLKSKLEEFNSLAREAEKEHERTAAAAIEESIPDVFVDDNLAESVLGDSFERLHKEISERADEIIVKLTENEIREFGEYSM